MHECFMKNSLMVPRRIASLLGSLSFGLEELHMSNTSVNDAMTNDGEQPVSWVRIVVLAALALPAFGGLYYALLDYLLFG
jgi:hypothetical protein